MADISVDKQARPDTQNNCVPISFKVHRNSSCMPTFLDSPGTDEDIC